ncbi:MAG: SIS domain-containing protein [Actinomycetota bacterium]|nr:SIS domain-containing protein [Actinomycetota bacterium]
MSERARFAERYRDRVVETLERIDVASLEEALALLERAWTEDRLVLLAGNGGSAATAEHMDLDLSKTIARLAGPGRGFRTIALTHGPALSAWSNDAGPEEVFCGQVRDLGRPGDVLLVFSAKGNSANVVAAVREARELGLRTIAFLGAGGGETRGLVDVPVVVDADDYGVIEDAHLVLNHVVTEYFADWAREPRERGT